MIPVWICGGSSLNCVKKIRKRWINLDKSIKERKTDPSIIFHEYGLFNTAVQFIVR